MSGAQDLYGWVRPWVVGEFSRRTRIISGSQGWPPYKMGTLDLAYNASTLIARARKPLVTDSMARGESAQGVTVDTTYTTWGWYVLQTPDVLGRVTLQIKMKCYVSYGVDLRVTVTDVLAGSVTDEWLGITTEEWFTVLLPGLDNNTLYTVRLEAKHAVDTSFSPSAIYIDMLDVTSDGLTGVDWSLEGVHPMDPSMHGEDSPLDVIMARDCIHNSNKVWANQTNAPVTASAWHSHVGDTSQTIVGLVTWYPTRTVGGLPVGGRAGLMKEWIYWPRPGVRALNVFVNGFVNDWTSPGNNAEFSLRIDGYDESQLNFTIASDTADYTDYSTWVLWGEELVLPESGAPLKIQLYGGYPTLGKPGVIQNICILESTPTIPTYG